MKRNLTELQEKVCDLARKQIEDKPWFQGICLDDIPSDKEILTMGLEESADQIALQTAYWDDDAFTK